MYWVTTKTHYSPNQNSVPVSIIIFLRERRDGTADPPVRYSDQAGHITTRC